MGNEEVSMKSEPQWQWVENTNGVEVYKNKADGKLAQRRKIILPGTYSLQEEMRAYSFRKNNQFGLVKSYEALQINKDKQKNQYLANLCNCSNQKILLEVYTERIPQRLSELPQLTFPQSLKVLKETSVSFEAAYQKIGGFHINPELIGINESGQIRVWVNQNWALNHPSHIIPLLKSSFKKNQYQQLHPSLRDESQMISNLINVVEGKNQQGRFPEPFANQLKSKSNFRTIRKFVNEFISNNKINIPNNIIKTTVRPFDAINKNSYTNPYPSTFNSLSPNPISIGKDYKINPQQNKIQSSDNLLKYTPFDYKSISFPAPSYSLPLQTKKKDQNKIYFPQNKIFLPPTLNFDPEITNNNNNRDLVENDSLKLHFASFLPPSSSFTSNSLSKPQSPLFSLSKFFEKDSDLKNHDIAQKAVVQDNPKLST